MKKTDIKIGDAFAVNARGYARQNQAAGDSGLAKGVIHSHVEGRYGKPGGWLVTLPEGYPGWDGSVRDVGATVEVSSRNVVAPWEEHVVAKAAREKHQAEAKVAAEKAEAALKAKVARLQEEIPAGMLPYWLSPDRGWISNSGQISVDQLLAIIAHAKQ